MQTSYDELKSSPKAHTSTMGKIPHHPTVGGPIAETGRRRRTYDGCGQPPTQAASIDVLGSTGR